MGFFTSVNYVIHFEHQIRKLIEAKTMSQRTPTKAEINKYSENFVLYGDKTKAAKKAFPKTKATKKAINELGSNLYAMPKVRQRIEELQVTKQEIAEKEFNINARYVLERLHQIDTLDIIDIVNDDLSGFKPLKEWPKAWRISISAMDMKRIIKNNDEESLETIIEKVKWPDKTKNLELIGKHVSVKAFGDQLGTPENPINHTVTEITRSVVKPKKK